MHDTHAHDPTPSIPPYPVRYRAAYPIEEARALLGGISRASIYELIRDGQLRSIKIAGRRLIPDDAIAELVGAGLGDAA